jgi:hypothetical protein
MTDNIGYGKEKRRAGNLKVLAGEATFRYALSPIAKRRCVNRECHRRDAFREMLDSVAANGHTFDECKELLKRCTSIDVFLRDCMSEV